MTTARITELRALVSAISSRASELGDEEDYCCVKCNESMFLEDGMDPTALCNNCAQEVAESVPLLLEALDVVTRERDALVKLEPKRDEDDRRYERTPSGNINNCALANFDKASNCQICKGECPDAHKFSVERRTP